jgi:hypothetical protein
MHQKFRKSPLGDFGVDNKLKTLNGVLKLLNSFENN